MADEETPVTSEPSSELFQPSQEAMGSLRRLEILAKDITRAAPIVQDVINLQRTAQRLRTEEGQRTAELATLHDDMNAAQRELQRLQGDIQNAEAVASRIRSEAQSKVEAEMGGYRELQLAKAQAEVEREMTSERQALALLQSERESLEATITTLRQDTARLQGEVNTLRDVKRQILGEMTAEA